MEYREFDRQVEQIIAPILETEGMLLVDLKISRAPAKTLIRLLADRPQGGITIQECARLNQVIGEALDKEDILSNSYILEVSSPGLDRPLKVESDFLRSLNQRVKIFLSRELNGKSEWEGMIKEVKGGVLSIQLDAGQILDIPSEQVSMAKIIITVK